MGGGETTLGTLLVQKGLLTQDRLDTALEAQAGSGKRLGEILIERGLLGEEALRWALAEQMDLPLVSPEIEALDPEALELLPPEICRRYGVIPLFLSAEGPGVESLLTVAAADPGRGGIVSDLAVRSGCKIRVVAALREEIEAALDKVHGPAPATDVGVRRSQIPQTLLKGILEDPTGHLLLRHLVGTVLERGAGGLHLRVRRGDLEVEDFDGRILFVGGATWHTILLDRLRQLAALESRGAEVMQKGGFFFAQEGADEAAFFRLTILKGLGGEEAQVALVVKEGPGRTLSDLGLSSHQAMQVRNALTRPGLFWVTATGEEGVASTLFALLRETPEGRGRTVTLEEQIVYRSPEMLQLESMSLGAEGRTRAIRELRYLEFERVMVDRVSPVQLGDLLSLALRKRWVFAATSEGSLGETLNVLASRALELPLYGLRMVVHQRLVPILCPECRVECVLGTADKQAIAKLVPSVGSVFQEGRGCRRCGGRGTTGNRAFFEVLEVDASVREALYGQARGENRIECLCRRVQPTIRSQVAEAVARGEVSLSELWDAV